MNEWITDLFAAVKPLNPTRDELTIPYHRPVDGVTVTALDGKVLVKLADNTPYAPETYVKLNKRAGGYVMSYKTFSDFWYAPYGKLSQCSSKPSNLYNRVHEYRHGGGVVEAGSDQSKAFEPSKSTLEPIDPRWNAEPWHWEAPIMVYNPAAEIEAKYAWIEAWEADPKKKIWRATIANGKANRAAEAAIHGLNVTTEFEKIGVNA